jgi:hypothetical protein
MILCVTLADVELSLAAGGPGPGSNGDFARLGTSEGAEVPHLAFAVIAAEQVISSLWVRRRDVSATSMAVTAYF